MSRPYVLFALGWGSTLDWAYGWMEHLAPALAGRGLLPQRPRRDEDWGVFDWGKPGCFIASLARPTHDAARALAARLPADRDEITLIGHSKAANLVLEYLAQVAEGRLAPHPGLRRALAINAPVDNLAARIALAHIDSARLCDLQHRLTARGATTQVLISYDPTDPVSRPLAVDGIGRCLRHTSGIAARRLPIGSLQVWHPSHLACLRHGWPTLLDALLSPA